MNVAALVPTYNRAGPVQRAIDSILAQTLPVNEIVVVDDGSTDRTADVLQARYGDRVRVILQPNGGVGRARQRALEESRSEWVAFLDADDLWHPLKLEQQFRALESLGEAYGLCFTNCRYVGNPRLTRSPFEEAGLVCEAAFRPVDDAIRYVLQKYTPIYIQSLVVRRSLLAEAGGFDPDLTLAEDTDILFRLTFRTRFCCVAQQLVDVDRTPTRTGGLVESFDKMNDRMYACMTHMLRKWLELPELIDPWPRAQIKEHLRLLHYGGVTHHLSHMHVRGAFETIHDLHNLGDDYATIFGMLASRAARKVGRKFGSSSPRITN